MWPDRPFSVQGLIAFNLSAHAPEGLVQFIDLSISFLVATNRHSQALVALESPTFWWPSIGVK